VIHDYLHSNASSIFIYKSGNDSSSNNPANWLYGGTFTPQMTGYLQNPTSTCTDGYLQWTGSALTCGSKPTVETSVTTSDNAVSATAVQTALSGKQAALSGNAGDVITYGASSGTTSSLGFDTAATSGSPNLITSGTLYTALNSKVSSSVLPAAACSANQNITYSGGVFACQAAASTVTVDDQVEDSNLHAVTSNAVYDALHTALPAGTNGNFAAMTGSTGAVKDSGKSTADFATAAQGTKADTALQPISSGTGLLTSTDGTLSLDTNSYVTTSALEQNIPVCASGYLTSSTAGTSVCATLATSVGTSSNAVTASAVNTALGDYLTKKYTTGSSYPDITTVATSMPSYSREPGLFGNAYNGGYVSGVLASNSGGDVEFTGSTWSANGVLVTGFYSHSAGSWTWKTVDATHLYEHRVSLGGYASAPPVYNSSSTQINTIANVISYGLTFEQGGSFYWGFNANPSSGGYYYYHSYASGTAVVASGSTTSPSFTDTVTQIF
jgi:hypothetical protein